MNKEFINDILQWDVKSWSKALYYWESEVDWSVVTNCLELGAREGGLSLWLASKQKMVVCSDLENVAQTSNPLHTKYSVESYITYQNINATDIPFENYFDVIVFKSIIGGIGRKDSKQLQQQVFDQIYKALKPGGKLLFAENLIASPLHKKVRSLNEWSNYWNYLSLEDLHHFLTKFSSFEIKTNGVIGTFGRTEKQRRILATMDDLIFNKIIPSRWKYIAYGVAQK
jgi:SAM-dependent methyltransferase